MARKALAHRKCDQRVPVDEIILKIAVGNPQGRLWAKKTFEYFSSFEKYFVVPWNGIEKRHGWQAKRTGKSNKPEQQVRVSGKSNKPTIPSALSFCFCS